jgi:hypothetical protein
MRDIITKLEEMNVEKPQLNEGLGDMAHEAEMDHEVQMARSDLYKTAKYAVAIHKMMKDVSEMEGVDGWVAAKITKAADYLSAVKHHMEGEMMADVELAVVPVAGDMTDAMTMPQESVEEETASEASEEELDEAVEEEELDEAVEEDVIGDIIAKLPKQSKAPGYTKSDSERMSRLVKQVDRVSQPSSPAPKGPKVSAVTKQKQANAAAKMQTQSKFSEWSKK